MIKRTGLLQTKAGSVTSTAGGVWVNPIIN